jgi:hypothetical protein
VNANIVRVCPKCKAYVASLKEHKRWHKNNKPTPGPPGPAGPMGMSGPPGTP